MCKLKMRSGALKLALVALFIFVHHSQLAAAISNTFSIVMHYPPTSASFSVRGNMCGLNWSSGQLMQHPSGNTWVLPLADCSIPPRQQLEFKVLAHDKDWQVGANEVVTSVPAGDWYVDVFPFFIASPGKYVYVDNVYSPQLGNNRDLVVYLPPSYGENSLKTYDRVLVMHDGQNLFNDSTAFGGMSWHCARTLDQLILTGQMEEVVVVGVDNTADRIDELTYSYDPTEKAGGKGDLYLDFIVKTVLPLAKNSFRINPKRPQLGILGSSLGGLISCYAGWTRSDVFGRIGCMSSSFWWNNEDFNGVILAKPKPTQQTFFYLDSGNSGPSKDDEKQTKTVRDHMQTLGYKLNQTLFYYLDQGGQHNEYFWGQRFHIPMIYLYPITPKTPVKV